MRLETQIGDPSSVECLLAKLCPSHWNGACGTRSLESQPRHRGHWGPYWWSEVSWALEAVEQHAWPLLTSLLS